MRFIKIYLVFLHSGLRLRLFATYCLNILKISLALLTAILASFQNEERKDGFNRTITHSARKTGPLITIDPTLPFYIIDFHRH